MNPAQNLPSSRRIGMQIVVLSIGMFALVTLGGYLIWSGYRGVMVAAETTSRNYAEIIEAQLDATLRRVESTLLSETRILPIAALSQQAAPRYAAALDADLDARMVNFPEIGGLRVYDANGDMLYTTNRDSSPPVNVADREFFRQARDDPPDALVFSEVVVGYTLNRPILVVARALRDEQGAFRGIVNAAVELDYFERLFQSLDVGPHGAIGIFRSDNFGAVVRWPNQGVVFNRPLPPGTPVRAAVEQGKNMAIVNNPGAIDGVRRYFSIGRLERYPFFITSGLAFDDILAGWRVQSLAVGLTGLMLLLVMGTLLVRFRYTEGKREQALAELSRSQRQFFDLFDLAPDGMVLVDAEGSITGFNRQAETIFGYSREEIVGQPVEVLMPVSTRTGHVSLRNKFLLTAMPRNMGSGRPNLVGLKKDGVVFPVDISIGSLDSTGGKQMIATVRDITERKRSESRLLLLQKVSLAIAEAGSFVAALEIVLRLVCEATNSAFGEAWLLDPSRAGLILGPIWDVSGSSMAPYIEFRRGRLLTPGPGQIGRAWNTRQAVWLPDLSEETESQTFVRYARSAGMHSAYAVPICSGNEMLSVLRFATRDRQQWDDGFIDIIEAVAAQLGTVLKHKRTEEQLLESQKMEAIGRLTGGMAHDFNNYLGVIIGNLELLKEETIIGPVSTKRIDSALSGAARAAELTKSLLAFSRSQSLNPEQIDIRANLEAIAQLLKRTIGEDIALKTELAPDLWPVRIDVAQLDSCIVNLVNNARDAMPQGGSLVIASRNVEIDQAYVTMNPDAVPGEYVLIEVSDTGSGMSPETVIHAFEPFFTTKRAGHGTGLGLSMVYGFVKQSGGHIKIYSEVGHGTTVRIYLPRDREAREVSGAVSDLHPARVGGAETILVVEDNEQVRQVVMMQLTKLGYRVIEAENGKAALEILDQHERQFDLLFTDVVMPEHPNGYELAQLALERRPGIGILLTSGFPGEMLRHNSNRTTPFNLLSKPYLLDDLARAVRAALDAPAVEAGRSAPAGEKV